MSNHQPPYPDPAPDLDTYDDLDGPPAGPLVPIEADGPPTSSDRFDDDVRGLRVRGGRLRLSERTLMVIGGVLAPLGLLCILLGWVGASRTPNVFEQIPYLISGGLFGLALVFLGAIFYFAHWLTELVRESRRQSSEVVAAIGALRNELRAAIAAGEQPPPRSAPVPSEPAALVATARGSMAHRVDCPVVAGKASLRPVDAGDGMAPCKLCDPYD